MFLKYANIVQVENIITFVIQKMTRLLCYSCYISTLTYEHSMQPSSSFFNTYILGYIELSLRQIKPQYALTNNVDRDAS